MSDMILETYRPDARVQRLRRGRQRRPQGARRLDLRPHRAERRRQDDLLQSPDEVPAADARRNPLQGFRHHRQEAGGGRAAGARPQLPDLRRLSRPHGARECAAWRCSARAGNRSTSGARSAASACYDERARELLHDVGLEDWEDTPAAASALWPQAGAGDRDDAGPRSAAAAARRADRRHDARGHRPHGGADQVGAGRPNGADGRAQSVGRGGACATMSS